MTTVYVMVSNTLRPYEKFTRETFHTRFAAELFDWLTCATMSEYHYWGIDKPCQV
jgi:hypothetical protein